MPVVLTHTLINPSFAGDTKSVQAIAAKLSANSRYEYKDDAATVIADIEKNLNPVVEHVLIISGTHGLYFLRNALKSAKVQQLIEQKKLIITWAGHQAPPDLAEFSDNIDLVAILRDAIHGESYAELISKFGARIIPLDMVPNTLTAKRLASGQALTEWNFKHKSNRDEYIPAAPNGYIGVFFGGDAPNEDGKHLLYSKMEAYAHGYSLGQEAMKTGKLLLITNGPRMGRIYPQSAGAVDPVLTRFKTDGNTKRWMDFAELNAAERNDPKHNPPHPDFRAHAKDAPLDLVTHNLLLGLDKSGLKKDQYVFIDFRFGDSAYEAIATALYQTKDKSVAYYSGESISQIELAQFLPTYAFSVSSMSDLHARFRERMTSKLHRVSIAQLTPAGVNVIHEVDPQKKAENLHISPETDAQAVAAAITVKLELFREVRNAGAGRPMVFGTTTSVSPADAAAMVPTKATAVTSRPEPTF